MASDADNKVEQQAEPQPDTNKQGAESLTAADEKPRAMIILKSKADGLKAAETFLRNRGWQIHSTTKLREALALMIQKQPPYLLIAADHPNKKVKVLPRVIAQAMPATVVAFCEQSSPANMRALNEIGLAYTLFPPISGPAIERMILKIDKDQAEQATRGNPIEGDLTSSSGGNEYNIKISGDNAAGGSMAMQSALSALMSDKDDEDEADGSGMIMTGGMGSNQQGTSTGGGTGGGAAYMPNHQAGAGNEQPGRPPGQQGPGNDQSGRAGGQGGAAYDPTGRGNAEGFGRNDPNFGNSDPNNNMIVATGGGRAQNKNRPNAGTKDPNAMIGRDGSNPGHLDQPDRTGGGSHNEQAARGANSLPDRFVAKGDVSDETINRFKSLIEEGTQKALDQSVHKSAESTLITKPQVKTSNLACITISSARFNGYLIAALGQNRQIDQHFFSLIRERLFNFLRNAGEIADETEESLDLQIQPVEFQEWSLESAEFLRKSVHGEDEIAMAFFPSENTKLNLEQSVSEKMVKMQIDELRDDVAIEFDLYIYLAENQRYLLYTPQGRRLFADQRGRLKKNGVVEMHLRKENVGGVKKYRAQNFLNDKITEFQNAKLKKSE